MVLSSALLLQALTPLSILGLVLLAVAWIRYIKSHYFVFTTLGFPGPEPIFLFGNALDFGKTFPLDLFTQWSKKYGKVFGYYEGLQPSVVVTCPEIAHEILVKRFGSFSDRPNHAPFLWEREDRNLQNSNGLLWKHQRQAVAGGMSGRCIREMYPEIQVMTDELMEELERTMAESPEGFRIDELMERYSVKVIAQGILGYRSEAFAEKDDVILRYMQAAHESASAENVPTGLARLFPLLTSALKPLDRKHKVWTERLSLVAQRFVDDVQKDVGGACPVMRSLYQAHTQLASVPQPKDTSPVNGVKHQISHATNSNPACKRITNTYPKNHRKEIFQESAANSKKTTQVSSTAKDYKTKTVPESSERVNSISDKGEQADTSWLSAHQRDSGSDTETSGLGSRGMADLAMGLLAAGLGPLAVTLTFVIYCLAVNEEEQKKVVEEIDEVTSCKDQVDLQDLKKLKSLERFIFEALRIFPVAPGVSRECVEDCVISGHKFTRGMVVRVMSGVMYRQEENFSQCQKFIPDRFRANPPRQAWMPFGHGPRKCVADRLSLVVFKLCTAKLLQRFRVVATEGTQVPLPLALRPFLVPRDGVSVKFVARQ